MTEPSDKDTRSLDALAAEANRCHRECKAAARTALARAVDAGRALIVAKAQVPHGAWGVWLVRNFEGSDRIAQDYMKLARNPRRVAEMDAAGISLRGALQELRPRTELCAGQLLPEAAQSMEATTAARIADWMNALVTTTRSGGHMAFSNAGRHPSPRRGDTDDIDPDRILVPLRLEPVTHDQMMSWLAEYRSRQASARAARERALEIKRLKAAARKAEREAQRGHRTGAFPCPTCHRFKSRPSYVCS